MVLFLNAIKTKALCCFASLFLLLLFQSTGTYIITKENTHIKLNRFARMTSFRRKITTKTKEYPTSWRISRWTKNGETENNRKRRWKCPKLFKRDLSQIYNMQCIANSSQFLYGMNFKLFRKEIELYMNYSNFEISTNKNSKIMQRVLGNVEQGKGETTKKFFSSKSYILENRNPFLDHHFRFAIGKLNSINAFSRSTFFLIIILKSFPI